jgi:membrane-associated phospholipid phosphatase
MRIEVAAEHPGGSAARGGGGSAAHQGSSRHERGHAWVAAGLAGAFLALTVLVVTGAADPTDARITHHFRPTVEWWGDTQKRYGPWMGWLEPARMFAVLAATCLVLVARRRSWWTVLFAVVPTGLSVAAAAATKATIGRPDPRGGVSASGGAYPSGHMVAVVVCVAVCLLVVSPRVRWWWWAAMSVPCWLMAASLVVTAAHWPSDVLGGGLLGGAVVAGASGLAWRGRAHRRE